jgi:hypothetical protein
VFFLWYNNKKGVYFKTLISKRLSFKNKFKKSSGVKFKKKNPTGKELDSKKSVAYQKNKFKNDAR